MAYPVNVTTARPKVYGASAPRQPMQAPAEPAALPTMEPDRFQSSTARRSPVAAGGFSPFTSFGVLATLVSLVVALLNLFRSNTPEAPAPAPATNYVVPDRSQMSDEDFVTSLYAQVLGRQPDPEGFQAHLNGLRSGISRQQILANFLNSDEYKARLATGATPAPAPAPVPTLPSYALPPLQTVPVKPEYATIPIDRGSDTAAIVSAATWVRNNRPELFVDDRAKSYEAMTLVIGILRANGFNATRCVNHPDLPIGNPVRVGSDSLVLNGSVYDCYVGMGDPNQSRPVANLCGPYEAGRLPE